MQGLHVVYLSEPHIDPRYMLDAVAPRHEVAVFDPAAPVHRQFAAAEVVIDSGGSVGTRAMLDAAPRARLWQISGSGFEHFDLAYWRSRGVPVANCPGSASAPALAERALLLCLMLAHGYKAAEANVHRGIPYQPMSTELDGKMLGLVGFGASATEFARLARAMGMRVAAVDIRDISNAEATDRGLTWRGRPEHLDELLRMSDVVSLHLHLDDSTRGIIDERRLRLLKPGAFVVNVARGALVDEAALVAALERGWIAGAGLDVFESEPPDPHSRLLQLPNVIATPHTAGNSDGSLRRRAEFCAHNIDRVAAGLEPECRLV
jgi:phosphoglycerate dehydrogenase-like enzyme